MAVALACPTCAHSVPVTLDMAGRRARCPHCRMDLLLPSGLIELPDRSAPDDAGPQPATRQCGSLIPWLLGVGAVLAILVVVCGAPIALVSYLRRSEREVAELAAQAKTAPPGANLPAGAPPRAVRVTGFAGVFQTPGQLVQGDVVFAPANGAAKNNRRVCKEYVIDLEAGRTYFINLDADTRQFDAYLRLAHLNGQVIAEDDDGGGNLNSQIMFTPGQTQSYLIVATSLGGGFGPFTLTVRESRFHKPR